MNELPWLQVLETLKYIAGEIEAAVELTEGIGWLIEDDNTIIEEHIADTLFCIAENGRNLEDIVREMEFIIKGQPSKYDIPSITEEEFDESWGVEDKKIEDEEDKGDN